MKSKKAVKAQIAEDQEVGVKAAEVQETVKTSTADFSIAGIGVSAGGLEALEQFLRNVPEIGGIAMIATGTKSDRTTPPAFPAASSCFSHRMPEK